MIQRDISQHLTLIPSWRTYSQSLVDYNMGRSTLIALFCLLLVLSPGSMAGQVTAASGNLQDRPLASASEQPAGLSFQPDRPSIYGTFYYPWYKNQEVDGVWSHWHDQNHSPPKNWFSNYLPLPPGTLESATGEIDPARGLYSSNDKDIFYWQLEKMAEANLEFAISSWWGRSAATTSGRPGQGAIEGNSDLAFRRIVTNWMNRADNPYPNLRWTIYYEKEGYANPSATEIAADLMYIDHHYAQQPAFLSHDGRPVIFIYGDGTDNCATVNRWTDARAQTGIDFYLVMKIFVGYASCQVQPDSWHEYAPAVRAGDYPPYSSFISPGFWKKGDQVRLPRNLEDFEDSIAAMVTADTQWKLVETWNEWGEGSAIEPGIQIRHLANGTAAVAPDGLPFEDHYIGILSDHLPPLEAGTGTAATAAISGRIANAAPAGMQPGTFVFGAGGDIGANTWSDATLRAIPSVNPAFFLAVGDMDYDEISPDIAFCDYVKARVGVNFPFEIVTGNHEEGSASSPGPDGYIGNHASCLPDRLGAKPVIPGKPAYPANYYFDYPSANPIMRVIMISANLTYDGVRYNFNTSEQTNYDALAATIDSAKQAGMWVVVGMHKVCLTTGNKSCEIGPDLMNLLVAKNVDLVFQGHDHNYQRSKQIALDTMCLRVLAGSYNPNCVADDGSDNMYERGAGTVFVINGNVGRCCYDVRANDSEAPYFAVTMGNNSVRTYGFVAYTVSPTRIDAQVINSVGTWGDSFTIFGDGVPRLPPVLIGPSGSTTVNPPTFTWDRARGAIAYEVQYGDTDPPTINIDAVATRYTPPAPLLVTTYFWRVRTRFSDGGFSDWSPTLNVSIESEPGAAPMINYYRTATPTLTWSHVTWATEYEIQVHVANSFRLPLSFSTVVPANMLQVTTATLDDGVYFWRTRARRSNGAWGPWSTIDQFVVDAP